MAINYILLSLSGLLYSLMFFVTQKYQKINGTSTKKGLILTILGFFVIFIFFLVKGSIQNSRFNLSFSWFTLLMTFLSAVCSGLCILVSIKILKQGEMSLYSIFMMAGAITLPSITGMVFFNEKVSALKIILLVTLTTGCFLSFKSIDKSKVNIKSILLYFLAFLLNGMKGVLYTIYLYNPKLTAGVMIVNDTYKVDADNYMCWLAISVVVVFLVVLLILKFSSFEKDIKFEFSSRSALLISVLVLPLLYGLFQGVGDYFLAISTGEGALNSSISFPICSGGTIIFSSLIGIIFLKEKFNWRKIICICIIILSTVGFMFI